jgi:hypothetical protein
MGAKISASKSHYNRQNKTMTKEPSEGETIIASMLQGLGIKYQEQFTISNLKYDKEDYRIADFYLPDYKVFIEFLGQWNTPEGKERYIKKMKVFAKNKKPCLYIFPDNLGAFEYIFDLRLQKTLRYFNMQQEINKYHSYKTKRTDNLQKEKNNLNPNANTPISEITSQNEKKSPVKEVEVIKIEQPKKRDWRKMIGLISLILIISVIAILVGRSILIGSPPTNIVVKPKVVPVVPHPVPVVPQPVVVKTDPIVAPADPQSTVDMLNGSLVGDWSGKFGSDNLLIHLEEIDLSFAITGYDQVGENPRNLNGRVEYNGNSNYTIILEEPGDDENDGHFKIKYIEGRAVLNGVWTANGNRKVGFTLKK